MNKQRQGSKSAARKKDYLEREKKRKEEKEWRRKFNDANNIESLADLLGVRLN